MRITLALSSVLGIVALAASNVYPTTVSVNVTLPTGNDTDNIATKYPINTSNPNVIRGVNLGGWLVLEPWITPSLFQQFVTKPTAQQAVDEWTFCKRLGQQECKEQLQKHWNSWVTQADINKLASYGLTHIRIPVGHWAFSPDPYEPYVQGQAAYVEKAVDWAQQANLKAILDLHGAPGSQNGFDNSGRKGEIHWQDNKNNVDRTLLSIQSLAQIAAKYPGTVDAIEFLNEPANWMLDMDKVLEFYDNAYSILQSTAPQTRMTFHDSFLPLQQWHDLYKPQWKKSILDTHIYHVFDNNLLQLDYEGHLNKTNNSDFKATQSLNSTTVPVITGEWSLATTDCAKWLNGFLVGTRWEGTLPDTAPIKCPSGQTCTCTGDSGSDPSKWSAKYWQFLKEFAYAQIHTYENALVTDGCSGIFKTEEAPQWNYMFIADYGLVPKFPKAK